MYSFAGKVYSGEILRGHIYGNSMAVIKRKASKLCNNYHHAIDEIKLNISPITDNRSVIPQ